VKSRGVQGLHGSLEAKLAAFAGYSELLASVVGLGQPLPLRVWSSIRFRISSGQKPRSKYPIARARRLTLLLCSVLYLHFLIQLESLIQMKQSELQRAGQLGQQILQQQAELEARVRELSEVEARSARGVRNGVDSDGEELGEETRSKLMELGVAVGNWKKENEVVWDGIKGDSNVRLLLRCQAFPFRADAEAIRLCAF
jgi:hypothetical protein